MTTPNDGGPAFPGPTDRYGHGMSLRDWFAGQALAGLAQDVSIAPLDAIAEDAYRLADALLAARAGKASDA